MYLLRNIFLLSFILFGYFAMAQTIAVDEEIQKIDSLIEYNQYDLAEKEADRLLLIFDKQNNKKYLEPKLRLLLLRGRMYEIKEENGKALEVLLEVVDQAESNKLYKIACHTNIILALIYEKAENPKLAKQYLDEADRIRKKHHIEELYSTILVRRSLYHRWYTKDIDSAMYYTKKALGYAKKHNNEYDITEALLMIGVYEGERKNYLEAVKYFPAAAQYYLKTNNYNDASLMYSNISIGYKKANRLEEALIYHDTAYTISAKASITHQRYITKLRLELFKLMNKPDSALFYLEKHNELRELEIKEDEAATIKNITEQYQNDKKEAVIKNKNQQMIFIGSFLGVIVIASVVLFRQNRKIKSRNKIINNQLQELAKTLEQKQMLLSELQHRVKNNLQHVISILEIQKESVNFNNIDELIRGNQNRIHSMALIHKKLNVSDNVNDVDLKRYVTELSELVKESYDNHKKKIKLNVKCEVAEISIEKAFPIGLIITELISNSMKHAFKKRRVGVINIELTKNEKTGNNQLYYSDNGDGFDFNAVSEKGLGQEIIKGLIDQLNGTTEAKSHNGFELMVSF